MKKLRFRYVLIYLIDALATSIRKPNFNFNREVQNLGNAMQIKQDLANHRHRGNVSKQRDEFSKILHPICLSL